MRALADGLSAEQIAREPLDVDAEALGVIPSGWYSTEVVHHLLDGVFGTLPSPAREAAMRDAAHSAIRATGRGVYRMVVSRLGSPGILAAGIQRLWRLLHDTGDREMTLAGETLLSRTRNWQGHGPLLCVFMTETTAALLETMGLREVVVDRERCVSSGASECVTHYRWQPR